MGIMFCVAVLLRINKEEEKEEEGKRRGRRRRGRRRRRRRRRRGGGGGGGGGGGEREGKVGMRFLKSIINVYTTCAHYVAKNK